MFGQLLTAFFSAVINRVVTTFKLLGNAKIYVIGLFITIISLSLIFKSTIEITIKGKLFSATDFRECRNPYALQTAMDNIAKQDTNITSYSVFLYEPKNQSFYKKLIITNNDVARESPSLQMRYLKDQPTINTSLDANGYFLIDPIDLSTHPDLKLLKDLGVTDVLYYRLSSNNVAVGEIELRFKHRPSPQELDTLLKTVSPFLYTYII